MNEQQGILYSGRRNLIAFASPVQFSLPPQFLKLSSLQVRLPSDSSPGQYRRAKAGKAAQSDNASESRKSRITPDQAKELFGLVDELLKFSSQETGLPIKSEVKRQLTTRTAVESYLNEKFQEDEDAKRMQRSEIVLKKFGMLDRDFDLKPFLLALLKEQIEAYYDPKTKTVNCWTGLGWTNKSPCWPTSSLMLCRINTQIWRSGAIRRLRMFHTPPRRQQPYCKGRTRYRPRSSH